MPLPSSVRRDRKEARLELVIDNVAVVIEHAYCPELKGCQSQGATVKGALANIREAIDLYLET
jgi:hypothetical protein